MTTTYRIPPEIAERGCEGCHELCPRCSNEALYWHPDRADTTWCGCNYRCANHPAEDRIEEVPEEDDD